MQTLISQTFNINKLTVNINLANINVNGASLNFITGSKLLILY